MKPSYLLLKSPWFPAELCGCCCRRSSRPRGRQPRWIWRLLTSSSVTERCASASRLPSRLALPWKVRMFAVLRVLGLLCSVNPAQIWSSSRGSRQHRLWYQGAGVGSEGRTCWMQPTHGNFFPVGAAFAMQQRLWRECKAMTGVKSLPPAGERSAAAQGAWQAWQRASRKQTLAPTLHSSPLQSLLMHAVPAWLFLQCWAVQ